jgi:hypothetical protein
MVWKRYEAAPNDKIIFKQLSVSLIQNVVDKRNISCEIEIANVTMEQGLTMIKNEVVVHPRDINF